MLYLVIWCSRYTSPMCFQVTDEANQMSELAGAKQKGEDKVRHLPSLPWHRRSAVNSIS